MLQEASGAAGHPSYRRYHYGSGPLLVEDAGTRRFISTDALGSTTDLTTTGATVASMRKYDAWGQYRNDTAPQASEPKLGFTGHQYDPETGLVYARARYYDPDLGRFLSRDSYEGTLTDAPSLHRFAYAWMNPLRYWDRTGYATEGQEPVQAPQLVTEGDAQAGAGPDENGGVTTESGEYVNTPETRAAARTARAQADQDDRNKRNADLRAKREACIARGECQRDTFVAGESDAPAGPPENDDPGMRDLERMRKHRFDKMRQYAQTGQQVSEAAMLMLPGVGTLYDLKLTADEAAAGNWQPALVRAGILLAPGAVVAVAKVGGNWVAKMVNAEAAEARAAARLEGAASHIGAGEGAVGGKANRINPSGRDDNCVAGVCAVIRNKLAKGFEGSADDVERAFGSVARARRLDETKALEYLQDATGLTASARPVAFMAKDAAPGHYAVFVGEPLSHALYGRVLPDGRKFLYDAQSGVKLDWAQAQQRYGRLRAWLLE